MPVTRLDGEGFRQFADMFRTNYTFLTALVPDAQSNELVIEKLRKAMEEQESVMTTQDRVLENKEADIQQMLNGTVRFSEYNKYLYIASCV